jgi:hypothetical protein
MGAHLLHLNHDGTDSEVHAVLNTNTHFGEDTRRIQASAQAFKFINRLLY